MKKLFTLILLAVALGAAAGTFTTTTTNSTLAYYIGCNGKPSPFPPPVCPPGPHAR